MQLATYKTLENQSIFDLSLQLCGDLESVFDLLVLNHITDLNDDTTIPSDFQYVVKDNYVTRFLKKTVATDGRVLGEFVSPSAYVNTGSGDNEITQLPSLKNRYTAVDGQNIFDVALQINGDLESVFDFLLENGLSPNSVMRSGRVIQYEGDPVMGVTVVSGEETYIEPTAFSTAFSIDFA